MDDDAKHMKTMRCPVCFSREIDVLLVVRADGYACGKCSFQGNRDAVLALYGDIKKKYRHILVRKTLADIEAL